RCQVDRKRGLPLAAARASDHENAPGFGKLVAHQRGSDAVHRFPQDGVPVELATPRKRQEPFALATLDHGKRTEDEHVEVLGDVVLAADSAVTVLAVGNADESQQKSPAADEPRARNLGPPVAALRNLRRLLVADATRRGLQLDPKAILLRPG